MPAAWKQGRGTFSLAVSTTPWLNKLMGLPFLLDYPHGCFEQNASRLLGYTFLGGLLDYLPDSQARRVAYQRVIDETLREFEAGLLADGRLPYWPGGTQPNDFVTIQTAWCVNQAEEAGFDVPERLASELPEVLGKMAAGKMSDLSPTLRAFALFVLSTSGGDEEVQIRGGRAFPQARQAHGRGPRDAGDRAEQSRHRTGKAASARQRTSKGFWQH